MKKIAVIFLFVVFSCGLYSQVTIYGKYADKEIIPCATIFGTTKITEKVGFTYFALVAEKWAETQIGISYSPVKWASFGLSGGLEQNPALYRLGASLWLGKGKTSFLILGEKGDGKENYWYKATLSYQASDNFICGARIWRFQGIGPFASTSIRVKKLDSNLWIMPAYDLESKTTKLMVGIDIKI